MSDETVPQEEPGERGFYSTGCLSPRVSVLYYTPQTPFSVKVALNSGNSFGSRGVRGVLGWAVWQTVPLAPFFFFADCRVHASVFARASCRDLHVFSGRYQEVR